jgi:hypothetical protein
MRLTCSEKPRDWWTKSQWVQCLSWFVAPPEVAAGAKILIRWAAKNGRADTVVPRRINPGTAPGLAIHRALKLHSSRHAANLAHSPQLWQDLSLMGSRHGNTILPCLNRPKSVVIPRFFLRNLPRISPNFDDLLPISVLVGSRWLKRENRAKYRSGRRSGARRSGWTRQTARISSLMTAPWP